MDFEAQIRALDLEEEQTRNLIAAHTRELTAAENAALDIVADKNRTIEEMQRRIDALEAEKAASEANRARAHTYEPPIIQVVHYG